MYCSAEHRDGNERTLIVRVREEAPVFFRPLARRNGLKSGVLRLSAGSSPGLKSLLIASELKTEADLITDSAPAAAGFFPPTRNYLFIYFAVKAVIWI